MLPDTNADGARDGGVGGAARDGGSARDADFVDEPRVASERCDYDQPDYSSDYESYSDRPTGALSPLEEEEAAVAGRRLGEGFPSPPAKRPIKPPVQQASASPAAPVPIEMGLTKHAQLLGGLLPSVVSSAAAGLGSARAFGAKALKTPPQVPKWLIDPLPSLAVTTERLELHSNEHGRLELRGGAHVGARAKAAAATSEADELAELRLLLNRPPPQTPQAFSAVVDAIAVE